MICISKAGVLISIQVDPETGDMIAFGYDMEGLDSPQVRLKKSDLRFTT